MRTVTTKQNATQQAGAWQV